MLSEVRTRPPLLVTQRLALRELRLDDARAVAERAGDKRVARYLIAVPSPYPVTLATRWIVARLAWWGQGSRRHDGDREARGPGRADR